MEQSMKTKTKKDEHTGFRNGDLFCFNCGNSYEISLPVPVKRFTAITKAFNVLHADCPKTWIEPVNDANGKSEEENIRWWMEFGEHGLSSKTMFNILSDDLRIQNRTPGTPSDPDDFRRCYLLLEAVPSFRLKLDRLKPINKTWSNLVVNWDKLTEMLQEQLKTKQPNGMYEFMKSLGC